MSAYHDALADLKSRACPKCLGNGTLAQAVWEKNGDHMWSHRWITPCEECAGSGLASVTHVPER